ncbi:MAG: EAL domain-containing protein [Rhodospirillales bacterium]
MATNLSADAQSSGYIDKLKRERDRFVALAFCAADVLIEVDRNRRVCFVAGATSVLTERPPQSLVGSNLADLFYAEDRPAVEQAVVAMTEGRRIELAAVRLAGPRGPTPPLLLTGYSLPDVPDTVFFALRLKTGPAEGDGDAPGLDAATGLMRREDFARAATRRLLQGGGAGGKVQLTMVHMGDLDGLRARLDEASSQELMESVGSYLRARSADRQTAGCLDDNSYGLVHDAGLDVGSLTAELEARFKAADPQGRGVSVIAGAIAGDLAGASESDVVKALLVAIGKFCAASGQPEALNSLSDDLDQLVKDTSVKMSSFRQLVAADNFDIAFQPIVSIADRSIHHYEALARFAGRSEHSPYELITFAENTGLICDFDYAMCCKVLRWLGDAKAAGRRRVVAVNISGRSIGSDAFVAQALELFATLRGDRAQLVIEITESATIRDLEATNKVIQVLRRAGHEVCLDDFGAGAAALRYLHALDVDVVKIDGQYVRGAAAGAKPRAFLKAVAALCRELGVATIAEMVEDEDTLAMLKACGIGFAQGYLLGRPSLDIAAFEAPPKDARGAGSIAGPGGPPPGFGGWARKAGPAPRRR